MKSKIQFLVYTFSAIFIILFVIVGCSDEDSEPTRSPIVMTLPVSEITETSAKSGGNVTDNGGAQVNSKGLVWCKNSDPSLESHLGIVEEGPGEGTFTSSMTGLEPHVNYYVRAYANNNAGTGYGDAISFTTLESLFQLEGFVKNSIGSGIEGATVYLVGNNQLTNARSSDLNPAFENTEKSPSASTDENGYFNFHEVSNGQYEIVVEAEEYFSASKEVSVSDMDAEVNIELEALELPQVTGLSISLNDDLIHVSWNALTNPTLLGYNHYEKHFFWHEGEWTRNQFHITPKYTAWKKTNDQLITTNTTQYNSPTYNGFVKSKVSGVNIDGVETPENESTIVRTKELPSKSKTLATFGLTSYSGAIDIPQTHHEIALHIGYFYQKLDGDVIPFLFDHNGTWAIQVSEDGSSWDTIAEHAMAQGSFVPSGPYGHTITILLNQYKGQTIYFKTSPSGGFHDIVFNHQVRQYSLDGSGF